MSRYVEVDIFIEVVKSALVAIKADVSGSFYTGADTILRALDEYAAQKHIGNVTQCRNCIHGKKEFIDNDEWYYCKRNYDYWTQFEYCSRGKEIKK